MSTINTDLLQNRLGTSHPAVTKADFVKVWARWTTVTTHVLQGSVGVTSVNDGGVGLTGVALTNVMANAYGSATVSRSVNTAWANMATGLTAIGASAVNVQAMEGLTTAPTDTVYNTMIFCGNLA